MREGAVFRDTVFEDWQGRRTRFETVHFASGADQSASSHPLKPAPDHRRSTSLSTGSAENKSSAGLRYEYQRARCGRAAL